MFSELIHECGHTDGNLAIGDVSLDGLSLFGKHIIGLLFVEYHSTVAYHNSIFDAFGNIFDDITRTS